MKITNQQSNVSTSKSPVTVVGVAKAAVAASFAMVSGAKSVTAAPTQPGMLRGLKQVNCNGGDCNGYNYNNVNYNNCPEGYNGDCNGYNGNGEYNNGYGNSNFAYDNNGYDGGSTDRSSYGNLVDVPCYSVYTNNGCEGQVQLSKAQCETLAFERGKAFEGFNNGNGQKPDTYPPECYADGTVAEHNGR